VHFSSLLSRAAACAWLFLHASLATADTGVSPPLQTPDTQVAPAAASSEPAETFRSQILALQQRARAKQLASSPMWRTLLHYQVHPLTRIDRSLADDADFFLAPDGARNPQSELDATLAAFFDTTVRHALDQSSACRFMARYQWLDDELSFDKTRMPVHDCSRYRQWRDGIKADQVTLIFPSAYLNSPASMYGHTFLRLDPRPEPGQTKSSLLSYAVNYAANGNENEGLAFAFKGLAGLYAGQFTNAPYYLRIREYNDLENRDIWEYQLSLTPTEIDRLLAHTWELGPTRFDYYFFDENCSYHLLSLLDAARPELRLSERFTWWAIPLDTVMAVTDTPGLLKSVQYRPSNSTALRYRADLLGARGARQAQDLSAGAVKPEAMDALEPDVRRRALILETAERLTAFEATRQASTEAETQGRRMRLLAARASLPAGPEPVVPTPATDPSQGHGTARVDLMAGRRNGRGIVQLQAHPAYHDVMDPEQGYQRGAAIQFFNVMLSREDDGRLQLERFVPVDITSLAPRAPLFAAKSWRVHIGLERAEHAGSDGSRPLGINLNGGPGLAWELTDGQGLLGYALLDNQARWDRSYARQPWSFGSGLAAGLIGDVNKRWRIQTEAFARAYIGGQPWEKGMSVQMRFSLTRQWNLTGRCASSQRKGRVVTQECTAGLQRYW
jgi:hypothetical protein